MKLEYSKQQNTYIWLGREWFSIFCSLPTLFFRRYKDIILIHKDLRADLACAILRSEI